MTAHSGEADHPFRDVVDGRTCAPEAVPVPEDGLRAPRPLGRPRATPSPLAKEDRP